MTGALGRTPDDFILDSYRGLFHLAGASSSGSSGANMMFARRMIPALVLTAGLATRLRPLSFVRAKAALPVAGEPLVRRILRSLAASGVTDAVLNLHHLPHTLTRLVGDGADLGVRVRYSWEVPVLGPAGGPRPRAPARSALHVPHRQRRHADRRRLARAASPTIAQSGALVTMAVVPNTRAGQVQRRWRATRDGALTGFARRGSPDSRRITSSACRWSRPRRSRRCPPNVPFEIEQRSIRRSSPRSPGRSARSRPTAEFFDIGTPADYSRRRCASPSAKGARPSPAERAVDPSARVERSVLWDDVVVEAGAMLRECVVTDGVRVPGGHVVARRHDPRRRRRARARRAADRAISRSPLCDDDRATDTTRRPTYARASISF